MGLAMIIDGILLCYRLDAIPRLSCGKRSRRSYILETRYHSLVSISARLSVASVRVGDMIAQDKSRQGRGPNKK